MTKAIGPASVNGGFLIPSGGFAMLRLLRRLFGRRRRRPAMPSAGNMALRFLEQFAAYMQGRS